jgi:uncharacterized protein YjbI with pentapeptide repeats
MISAKRKMSSKAKSLVGLPATGALLLFLGVLLPFPVHAFDPKDLERVLKGGDCPGCDLSGADLFARNLANINLSGANLSRAKLSFASLKSGNLSRADLSNAELAFSFLVETNLTQANLSQAELNGAYLHKANLEGAILAGADLSRGHLFDANLKGADLKKAKMEGTNLSGANLERSNLDQASFSETIYDATTRFPSGFKINPSAFTIVQPKTETYEPPDRTNARLAEIHQLSFANMVLTMGAADGRSYGGCKDNTCFDLPVAVSERLARLTLETYGENSLQYAAALLSLASLNQERGKYIESETLYLKAFAILEKNNESLILIPEQVKLAQIYRSKGRLADAELMFRRSLKLMDDPKLKTEQNNVLNNLYLDTSLGSLVEIYILTKKYADAESMIQRLMKLPMEVRKDSLRQNDLRLAWLKHAQGNSKEAEALYRELIEYYKKEFPNGRLPILTLVELNLNQLNKRLPPIIDSKP